MTATMPTEETLSDETPARPRWHRDAAGTTSTKQPVPASDPGIGSRRGAMPFAAMSSQSRRRRTSHRRQEALDGLDEEPQPSAGRVEPLAGQRGVVFTLGGRPA